MFTFRSKFNPFSKTASSPVRKRHQRKLQIDALEDRAVPAAPTIEPIADRTLLTNQSVLQVPVVTNDADGDAVDVRVRTAASSDYFLLADLKLTKGSRPTNWGGGGEKWFRSSSEWYFVKPDGGLYRWDGADRQATGTNLASLPPVYFALPDLVTKPRSQDLASLLNQRLSLAPTVSPEFNSLGKNEKWLHGAGATRYFILPNGELYRQGSAGANVLYANLDAAFYEDLSRLYNARPQVLKTVVKGSMVQIDRGHGAVGNFAVEVAASDGALAGKASFAVAALGTNAPVIPQVPPQALGVGEQSLDIELNATDADGDALTYTAKAAGSEAYFHATELQLKASTRPVNWGRQGERWFTGQGNYYFLLPGGDLYKWDGVKRQASGDFIATLPPVYFYYPDLLTKPKDQDLAYVLDQRLGLSPSAKPAPGSLGLNEKWLTGLGGTVKFFITPEGALYRSVGSKITWLADLGTGVYKQPARLYAAPRDRFSASVDANGKLTVQTKANYIGQFAVQVTAADGTFAAKQIIPFSQSDYENPNAPRVVGALSSTNRKVVVSFSQPMNNSAVDPANYEITQPSVQNGAPELEVVSARFLTSERTAVELTTLSQSQVPYVVAVVNVKDLGGKALAPATVTNGVLVDPTRANFVGKPPSAADLTDSDGDGLLDYEEQQGWGVNVKLINGSTHSRWVTSNPFEDDSDNDGLPDAQEANLRLDPRDRDTDDDQLTDSQEFNEIYSDSANQDSDNDGLDDSIEFGFYHSSPVHFDTDGDQIRDGDEILLGNRNVRIADLPLPAIKIGNVDLGLNVKFNVTDRTGTTQLDSKTVNTTLTQSESTKFSNTDGNTQQFSAKIGTEVGFNTGGDGSVFPEVTAKFTAEAGYSGQWSSSFTRESADESQREVSETFQTDKTVSQEQTVERVIEGAIIKAEVNIQSLGDTAFTIGNLQLTAFFQDPKNPTQLIPIGTLVPETPAGSTTSPSFNLGPLVPERGPFIFVNDQVFPSLVQDLMLNPQGLVFKISNFDMVDELGRNFAFTSQDINDRTAPVVIDFGGGAPEDEEGLYTERYRVATSAGRVVADTNGDGLIDNNDRPMPFDADGKATGIPLKNALESILGLKHYDEGQTPTGSLTGLEKENSYSTKIVNGKETLWRLRGVSKEVGNSLKHWVVLTPTGIDSDANFGDIVLQPGKGITLSYVQDLDDDRVPATWEAIQGTSDESDDTDGDGLSDGFEFFGSEPDAHDPTSRIEWKVEVAGKAPRIVTSSGARADSDADGISDSDEYNRTVNGALRSLDPKNPDTDGDGVTDKEEIDGYTIQLRQGNGKTITVTRKTDPLDPDSEPGGGDGLKDGDERTLGLDPLVNDLDKVQDNDGDGRTNFEEDLGQTIKYTDLNGVEVVRQVWSNKNKADSDGDGLSDKQEFVQGTNPGGKQGFDLDGDGNLDVTVVHDLRNALAYLATFVGGVEQAPTRYDLSSNNKVILGSDSFLFSDTLEGKLDIDKGDNGSVEFRAEPQDTDLDRLSDTEELGGVTLNGGTVVTTDPLKTDMDGDKRSDGDEVKESWIVNVSGQAPEEVFSNPTKADEDADSLNDGQEFTYKSDPQNANTDGDQVNDGREIVLGTNPLVKDQKVVVTILSATADKVPEGLLNEPNFSWLYGTGEWAGSIKVQRGSNAEQELFALSALDNTRQGDNLAWGNNGVEFVVQAGEQFRVYSEGTYEKDAADATELTAGSYNLDEVEEKFNENANQFPLSTTTKTLTLVKSSDTGVEGKVTLLLEVKVLT